jgi:phosphoglycerate dehydrogenase-like enzyme
MKVLFTGCTFNEEKLNELKEQGIEVSLGRMDYSEEELIDILKNYDCYINGGDEICTRKVIENNKHLKLISFMGTGYQKYIDIEAAKENNIPVTYTPSANAKAVAEYTVALILDAVKKITFSNNEVRNKEWNKIKNFNLEGKTLGIVGMGAIGTHIAKILCDGFGMQLIYNSRSSKPDIDSKYNTNMVTLNELFSKADIISVNATYTKENINLISKEQLDLAKDNLIFVNTARQELVNKEDLYNAIINNKIGFVAMDGFYEEPITKETNEKFLDLPNNKFLLTPHNAYNSSDAVIEMERMLIESLTDVKNGVEIRNSVK